MNDPFLHKIQIFLPETQLQTIAAGSRDECETEKLVPSKGKRKVQRERQSLESGSGSSHHRQYPTKKSKQKENNDVYTHLHPLQDYLHPGLDGTPFSQWCLCSQSSLDESGVLWNQVSTKPRDSSMVGVC
ncbi:hypothetical protein OG21DRAFT_170778 [Imleria badia]|nr:hypothetical protein OG21DRAFT_170778 [Imleria badia]